MSETRKLYLQKFEHALKREIDPLLVPKIMEGSSDLNQEKNEEWLKETFDMFKRSCFIVPVITAEIKHCCYNMNTADQKI